jgi:hypothetical protein
MPRETVRRHMGRLVALGLFERAEDQTFVPTKELREVEIDRALRLLRQGTAGLLWKRGEDTLAEPDANDASDIHGFAINDVTANRW